MFEVFCDKKSHRTKHFATRSAESQPAVGRTPPRVMVVSFKYLLRIWLIMIVVQVVWLHYQPINMTKLDAIYYACAIWQLFLVGGEGKAGIVFWYLHFHDHYLISRNYFIITVITGVHCSVRQQGRVVCGKHTKCNNMFPSEQTRKYQQTSKKLFWVDKQYKLCTMQWRQARCTLRWTLDTGQAVQCKKILPRSRVPWIS